MNGSKVMLIIAAVETEYELPKNLVMNKNIKEETIFAPFRLKRTFDRLDI